MKFGNIRIHTCWLATSALAAMLTFGSGCVPADDSGVETRTAALESGEAKVEVCHFPPGNEENEQAIVVGESAVQAHLDHGDELGDCIPDDDSGEGDSDGNTVGQIGTGGDGGGDATLP